MIVGKQTLLRNPSAIMQNQSHLKEAYAAEFDVRRVEKTGWFADNLYKLSDTKDDVRFAK